MCADRLNFDSQLQNASISNYLLQSTFPLDLPSTAKICKQICLYLKSNKPSNTENVEILQWIIQALRRNNGIGTLELLHALQNVLKNKCDQVQCCDELVGKQGLLLNIINSELNFDAIKLVALKCLQNLTYCHENFQTKEKNMSLSDDHLNQTAKSVLCYLYKKRHGHEDEATYCEIIICVCKILIQIYSNNNDVDRNLGETIGACRYWMLYSLKDNKLESPKRVTPSQQTVAEMNTTLPKKGGKRMKLRRHRNIKPVSNRSEESIDNTPIDDRIAGYTAANICIDSTKLAIGNSTAMTSDSDVSDSDNAKGKNLASLQAKIRLAALNLLSIIIKTTEKHVIFGYWWALLPDGKTTDACDIGGLALAMLWEPTVAGRSAAFTVLLSLLSASRAYLLQADTSKHLTLSFTPFSVALGISLENLHRLLSTQLAKEKCIPVLVTVLKCTAACIQASPYHKLGGAILMPIVTNVRQLLEHNDWTVQVASLIVMGCIISVNPPLEPVLDCLKEGVEDFPVSVSKLKVSDEVSDEDTHSTDDEESSVVPRDDFKCRIGVDKMNWLLKICLKNLGWTSDKIEEINKATVPTRLESLQVLSAMALQYFDTLLVPFVHILTRVLSSALEDNSTEICLHAAKCVGAIGDAMQKSEFLCIESTFDTYVKFWNSLLCGSLTKLLQSEFHSPARAAACDSLGAIGEKMFVQLEDRLKILTTTLLLGCSGDSEALIRAAAVRALAVCIIYQQWREDPSLVSDCVETVLRISAEPTLAVRIKATWALANITDALLLNMDNPEIESIDDHMFCKLLEASITASNENDKVKMNAMRAIGNMVVLISDSHLKSSRNLPSLALSAVKRLEQCAVRGNNMKVRWNACHALGKILKNITLYNNLGKWQESVLESLCELLGTCRNLKVCIHAASALCSPMNRRYYGDSYIAVWTSILKALNSVYHTEDFTEYKHKNNLIDQLCVTLSHLACSITSEDLADVLNPLCFYWEIAAKLLQEVIQRTEPQSETCSKLLNAAKYVTTELSSSNDKQTQSLNILQNMFIWDYC
ncbi:HEAT repeat-containing protein 6 [Arctopsyche grandis]|uniref:HEAT repeat-containing protein 6 n=1 Tax=Arctopsyche grandis TaxID=121162 RepID=UPI00406DA0F4